MLIGALITLPKTLLWSKYVALREPKSKMETLAKIHTATTTAALKIQIE